MSLIGIRDMSVLEEPPMDRVPIQTYVMEYNDELVREAINLSLIHIWYRKSAGLWKSSSAPLVTSSL